MQIDQMLKDVAGVQLFRRSDARSGHPTSQGVTLRALGGNASSRALLVLDGVPQADPFGGWVNWPAYDPENLADIRVVRGGGSVANGPGALAGTVEMSSRADAGTSGELAIGSRRSSEASGRLAARLGSTLLSVSGREERGDGFIPITVLTRGPADSIAPYRAWDLRGRMVTAIDSTTEFQANVSGFHDFRTRGLAFSDNRTNGADASLRLVGRGAWQWSALGYWQWRNLMSGFASVTPLRTSARQTLLQYSVPSHGAGGGVEVRPPLPDSIELRIGSDARRTSGESREYYSYVASAPTRRREAGGESWTAGAFAEGSAPLGPATLTAGARIDHWSITNGHLLEQTIPSGSTVTNERDRSRSGWLPTARAGFFLPIHEAVTLRGAAYLGWRMPTLNELFRPFRAGADATAANALLDPERLRGAEIGVDSRAGPITLKVTAFANRLTNAIANVTLGNGPGTFPGVGFVAKGGVYRQRQNVDAIVSRGIEASAGWAQGPWFARAGASVTHARIEATGAAGFLDGLRPAQTPGFAATLTGGWDANGKSAEIDLRRIGAQFEDDLNSRTLRAATTFDASAAWPLSPHVQLFARAENLANALVEAAINSDGSVERATPRTLWVGLRLR